MKRENHNMLIVKSLFFSILCFGLLGCTQKTEPSTAQVDSAAQNIKQDAKLANPKLEDFSKSLRESIYFSGSLEREALKLIFKDSSLQKLSLFGVLSYIVEIHTGAKKTTPRGLDCGKFEVRRDASQILILKTCLKPAIEIAKIKVMAADSLYNVEFYIKEWANVVGLAVSLTGQDVSCQIKIKDKKLVRLNCDNWSYQIGDDMTSATVLKTKVFLFERSAAKQFVIKGGFHKELIENKKIDIVVPLEGKIKIIEKEIKVIDEFAEIIKRESEKRNEEKKEIKNEGVSEEGNQEVKIENGESGRQESPQEDDPQSSQDVIKEAQEENKISSPEVSPRRSRGR